MAVASLAASAAFRNPGGVIADLELPQVRVGHPIEIQARERHRRIALHVPGVVATENGRDAFLGHGRPAEKRIAALPARIILTRPFGIVVDSARVAGNFVVRPILGEPVGLADSRGPAARGISDRLKIGASHSLERSLQNSADIRYRLCQCGSCHQAQKSCKNTDRAFHTADFSLRRERQVKPPAPPRIISGLVGFGGADLQPVSAAPLPYVLPDERVRSATPAAPAYCADAVRATPRDGRRHHLVWLRPQFQARIAGPAWRRFAA